MFVELRLSTIYILTDGDVWLAIYLKLNERSSVAYPQI